MADCDADPAITRWARRFTRNPRQFESRMADVLPRLAYVQTVARKYDVAGEFVLLPWVESRFTPVSGKKGRPAGMWQIMPITAGAMGLRVDGHYDGRLDVPAAANAVMRLLEQYHDQFHDWRVADYAYNAGEFSVRKIIRKHGMPPEEPVIPAWPVRAVTKEHLTKLLAIACVVREPSRFSVKLPVLPAEKQLVRVEIPRPMEMPRAASHAGMSVSALRQLNGAFRGDMIDTNAADYLLLPASHVEQFRNALRDPALIEAAHVPGVPPADGDRSGKQEPAGDASSSGAPRLHTVKRGESLWQIARKYSVTVPMLQRWNHLPGKTIKAGQVLQIGATD